MLGENFSYWKYLLLEDGDIMQEGDEYYNPMLDEWVPLQKNGVFVSPTTGNLECRPVFGQPFSHKENRPIRRKNVKYMTNA